MLPASPPPISATTIRMPPLISVAGWREQVAAGVAPRVGGVVGDRGGDGWRLDGGRRRAAARFPARSSRAPYMQGGLQIQGRGGPAGSPARAPESASAMRKSRPPGPPVASPSDGSVPIPAVIVLQSGTQWVSVAQRVDPGTGVVRLLPPRHSGPDFSQLPLVSCLTPSAGNTNTASTPRTASRFRRAGAARCRTVSFSSPASTPASRSSRRRVMTTGARAFSPTSTGSARRAG